MKAEGDAERSDRFIARVTAEIIDVKPNGTLVLEARKSVAFGRESKSIVLSGTCREEDVSDANTVTSSQLANLTVVQEMEGDVDRSSKKGLSRGCWRRSSTSERRAAAAQDGSGGEGRRNSR